MPKHRIRLKHRLFTALDLPQEAVGDVPKLTQVGRGHMLIENHRGVFEYTPDSVRLITVCGLLRVTGNALILREISKQRLYISGTIDSTGFEDD
ncbi:MAG: YabP/YqfC family sporulation protein [Clostridia bacterium]